uniref:Uncharacterized protein n=1 Tax=Parascaris univalens TaxID=6257 RepID=A0A914ZNT9_PARUN
MACGATTMKGFYIMLIFASSLHSVAEGISCLTCSDETCPNSDQWVLERCPPVTKFCYRFVNANDRVYGLGCSSHEKCDQIGGYVNGTACNTCDSDVCNAYRQQNTSPPGGGAAWSASPGVKLFPLVIFAPIFLT